MCCVSEAGYLVEADRVVVETGCAVDDSRTVLRKWVGWPR